jgi:hypothetical protein
MILYVCIWIWQSCSRFHLSENLCFIYECDEISFFLLQDLNFCVKGIDTIAEFTFSVQVFILMKFRFLLCYISKVSSTGFLFISFCIGPLTVKMKKNKTYITTCFWQFFYPPPIWKG